MCVKAPGFGDNRKASLQDMAILTGAQLVSDDLGLKLDKVEPSMLGQVKKVVVGKDDTVLLDGAGSSEAIQERIEQIRATIESATSEYEKEKLQERLAKLAGGVAVIKVGLICVQIRMHLQAIRFYWRFSWQKPDLCRAIQEKHSQNTLKESQNANRLLRGNQGEHSQ